MGERMQTRQSTRNIDPKSSKIFLLTNQIRRENVDVVGNDPVRTDAGEMPLSKEAKLKGGMNTMKDLNVVFEWDPENISDDPPLEGYKSQSS